MQHTSYPSPRTLLIIWLLLMGLTVTTMIAGKVTATMSIGTLWLAVLLIVAGLKSSIILHYYLDLKSASTGWNKLFSGLVWFILFAVFAIYMVGINI